MSSVMLLISGPGFQIFIYLGGGALSKSIDVLLGHNKIIPVSMETSWMLRNISLASVKPSQLHGLIPCSPPNSPGLRLQRQLGLCLGHEKSLFGR